MAADDHFSLFGLPTRFALDPVQLEQAWRAVAARVHPDRYATASAAERRVAMQWRRAPTRPTGSCATMLRARYLCEQAGVDLQTESNTAMDPAFLMQQMEWREMLDDARRDPAAFAALRAELEQARLRMQQTLSELIDERGDYQQAGTKVREWMFVEKLAQELSAAQPMQ